MSVRYAHVLAGWSDQMDAIGSKRDSREVEAAEWKIALYLLGALGIVLFGLYLLVTALL
ncbi:hypothetical protein [Haladaptatus sp. NG-WS-4]